MSSLGHDSAAPTSALPPLLPYRPQHLVVGTLAPPHLGTEMAMEPWACPLAQNHPRWNHRVKDPNGIEVVVPIETVGDIGNQSSHFVNDLDPYYLGKFFGIHEVAYGLEER